MVMDDDFGHLPLNDDNFPSNFVDFQHPDDYKVLPKPIEPEYIIHRHSMRSKLIYR